MSLNGSLKSSNSQSEPSTNSSPNQHIRPLQSGQKTCSESTIFGSQSSLTKPGAVRRAASVSSKQREPILEKRPSSPSYFSDKSSPDNVTKERYRRSLDSAYRHSLEFISEYKAKNSFSAVSFFPDAEYNSIDSSSSSCADLCLKSTSEVASGDQKKAFSHSDSYLSWIESVNNECFSSATTSLAEPPESKIGEWNNFWLNYSTVRGTYLSNHHLSVSNDERTADDMSDSKSATSTQKDFNEKSSSEYITLHLEEVNEVLKYSQRITDILQQALKRSEQDFLGDSINDSYYSQAFSQQDSLQEDIINKSERSNSYAINMHDYKKHLMMGSTSQSSSNSCINAILNTGVADMLKRVINKRKSITQTDPSPRESFSDGTVAK